jgi:hypothetical protein
MLEGTQQSFSQLMKGPFQLTGTFNIKTLQLNRILL